MIINNIDWMNVVQSFINFLVDIMIMVVSLIYVVIDIGQHNSRLSEIMNVKDVIVQKPIIY